MSRTLSGIDHVHVFVADRAAAETWYRQALGFKRVSSLESWAVDGGPLTIEDESSTIHLALFEQPRVECRSTIALRSTGIGLLAWRRHLCSVLGREIEVVDHELSWSLYFEDPDGNSFEITSYDFEEVKAALRDAGT